MMRYPDATLPWPIPYAGVQLLAEYEQGPTGGCALAAYRCPAGVWTIGWGETDGVRPGDVCTPEQADRWLVEDLTERAAAVREMCSRKPSPHELAALVSLAYNVGLSGLRQSTALRQHNAGHAQAAARAFGLWNKARVGGQLVELPGLTARRAREAALYLTPDADAQPRMPQAVEAESSLARLIAAGSHCMLPTASQPPQASGMTWSTSQPGHAPVVRWVDGHACSRRNSALAVLDLAMEPSASRRGAPHTRGSATWAETALAIAISAAARRQSVRMPDSTMQKPARSGLGGISGRETPTRARRSTAVRRHGRRGCRASARRVAWPLVPAGRAQSSTTPRRRTSAKARAGRLCAASPEPQTTRPGATAGRRPLHGRCRRARTAAASACA